jgi:hypothetical protein
MAAPMNSGDAQAILALIGAFGAITPAISLVETTSRKTKKICIILLIVCGLFVAPGLGRLWTIALLGA